MYLAALPHAPFSVARAACPLWKVRHHTVLIWLCWFSPDNFSFLIFGESGSLHVIALEIQYADRIEQLCGEDKWNSLLKKKHIFEQSFFPCLAVLASSLVFNLADGQFSSRADLIDAPGSSLGRGAQVSGLGESTAAVLCWRSLIVSHAAPTNEITWFFFPGILGLVGACYDALNNLIWTCSSDYIDQWCNPGNQAFHHVCHRLGVSHVIKEPKGRF